MKRAILFVLLALCIFCGWPWAGWAQTVLRTATPQIGWDAQSIPNLPATSVVSYDYGYKLSPQATPTVVGNTAIPSATYNLTVHGSYVLCARTVLQDSGTVIDASEWACSDAAVYCLGGVTFVDRFWPYPLPVPGGLAPKVLP